MSVNITWKRAISASIEVEAVERSEIFNSIATKRRPTAVISCSIRSVASVKRGSAGRVAEQRGIACVAMGLGSEIASENSSKEPVGPPGVTNAPALAHHDPARSQCGAPALVVRGVTPQCEMGLL
ncbi:hypothetical protein NDU88_008757 [Pleurodeles waltl]|uniref:Uncharacterized protein n=1 Tax=Pleurodeles waltl TaxID=8319 RepID=A0AAV7PT47_PLEWA|nr:hypothetical protein NDU88_008757 [Pleurodeles waltl]